MVHHWQVSTVLKVLSAADPASSYLCKGVVEYFRSCQRRNPRWKLAEPIHVLLLRQAELEQQKCIDLQFILTECAPLSRPRAPAHLALSSRPIELFWEVEAVHISRCGLHDDGGRLGLSGALANSNAAKKQAAAHAGEPPMDAEGVGGRLRKGLRCASTPAMRVPPALALLWHCYPHTVWGKRFLGLGFLPRPPGSLTWACWFTAAATRPREAGRWRGGYPDSARVP